MPKRTDIESILILGAGPIIIGQACEFDYSGAQACKALREEGYRVILVNSNPATIMTDPSMADATYIEPIRWEIVTKVIAKERPCAVLPTMGGQTALNCALDLERKGVLEKYNCELIGAHADAIDKAEDRHRFGQAMQKIGLQTPKSGIAHSMSEALEVMELVGLPCIIRPSFTMGGTGGGIAYNKEEFVEICERGLDLSPTQELLIDESLIGWKEFELEVIRDANDNCIIVCSIENLDPLGIHTGDSITVAPIQTLTDKEYQLMRNQAIAVLREIGVETGGSNVQFAVNPKTGQQVVIEMNPRVSRSSALASKATGFPIARVAAKLAVGYHLDELKNEITQGATPASFEPTLDYVVTKIPRFAFEKFPTANDRLVTQMKSVGEVMAIGRTFQESLQKALRGLETDIDGLDPILDLEEPDLTHLSRELTAAGSERIRYVADAMRLNLTLADIHKMTGIDPWFLAQISDLIEEEKNLAVGGLQNLSQHELMRMKGKGFSDRFLAKRLAVDEASLRAHREALGVKPVYKRIDSCAGEFDSSTAYLYSTYGQECEAQVSTRPKIVVLGGGPNRIGQGIEFDYCCVHASMAMKEMGYETIMINSNPETVSTDYDSSDRLYFEPITLEDVLAIIALEQPKGVVIQCGGQTPLKLAKALQAADVPIMGTSPTAIDTAEDRELFQALIQKLGLKQPLNATAKSLDEALDRARTMGFPLIVRPSYVLGGRAMEIVQNLSELSRYMERAVAVSHDSPVLLDHFLERAIEVDIDALCDGETVVIGALMQHIEPCGVHSGDSACVLPPYSLSREIQDRMRAQVKALALELGIVGFINCQMAVQDDEIYVIEVNPRASRTVPFISKCINRPLANLATKVSAGKKLAELGFEQEVIPAYVSVKEAVFPFNKFPDVDPILGPEMKSTGEVMGVGETFAEAYSKAQLAVPYSLPKGGKAILSICDADKPRVPKLAGLLLESGFELYATAGTAQVLQEHGIAVQRVNKCTETRPDLVDMIKNDEVDLVLNTTAGRQAILDSQRIRKSALQHKVLHFTTMSGCEAIAEALNYSHPFVVRSLEELYATL